MIRLTLAQAAAITQGQIVGEPTTVWQGLSIDSRQVVAGNLFIALRGTHTDGHQFVAQAAVQGAAAALVTRPSAVSLPQLIVPDVIIALGQLAKAWRANFSLPMVALTGSNGKTTTKNMLAAILRCHYAEKPSAVLATQGNLNNHLGVPLMLGQLNFQHQVAVLEMGMNHFHEIEYLTQLVSPAIALITQAGPCHLEGVGGTLAGVAKAKGEIFSGLAAQGTAIINRDDAFADYWLELVKGHPLLTFGFSPQADVCAEMQGKAFLLRYQNETILIQLQLLGQHNVMNALAASSAALALGVSLPTIQQALQKLTPAPGRMEMKKGQQNTTIIDDTYNANPASLAAALQTIASWSGEKILALGDMRELGENAIELHHQAGKVARELGFTRLLATGECMRAAVESFGSGGQHFGTQQELIDMLLSALKPNMIVLVKGSRSMQMEKIVQALLPHTAQSA